MLRPFPSYASTLLLDSERHHHKSGRRLFGHQKIYRHARIIAVSSSEDDVCNYIPAASIILPDGPWTQISGGVVAAKGFKAAGIHAGLRAKGERPDLALVLCETDAISAGAFTTNVVAAAPVTYCKHVLHTSRKARAVLINAGQANAATGEAGFEDTLESAKSLAQLLHVRDTDVLIESTGVIGQRIKKESLLRSLPVLVKSLTSDIEGSDSASIAITTTDLVRKTTAVKIQIGGVDVRIGGMAKGSGMIHPNMATMLAVFTTDAGVASDVWRKMVRMAVDKSFNQITVDGDTSTNDCVIALASGLSGSPPISSSHSREAQQLQLSLVAVMQGLARAIASDGEGATCLVEVMVTGADTEADAAKIARTVASSSLTKAAVYGRDPNWGRIACAAGYAGVAFQPRNLHITLGDIPLMANGRPLPFNRDGASSYMRKAGNEHGTVQIHICVGNALGTSVAWGCDMSYDYVKINAEYTS